MISGDCAKVSEGESINRKSMKAKRLSIAFLLNDLIEFRVLTRVWSSGRNSELETRDWRSPLPVDGIDKSRCLDFLDQRIVEKLFRFHLLGPRTLGHIKHRLDLRGGHERHLRENILVVVIDRFQYFSIIGLEKLAHRLHRRFFIPADHRHRFDVPAEKSGERLVFFTHDLGRRQHTGKKEWNSEFGDVEDRFEPRGLCLE